MAGISNLRPPKTKVNIVWNVDQVLKYIKSLPPLHSQTVKQTTLKTVMLCALVATARANELHKLDLACMIPKTGLIEFQIPGRVKHSRQGKPNPPIVFTEFPSDPDLCPVKNINNYIKMTKPWREGTTKTGLFLSTVAPHDIVAKTTLSNWIKQTLSLAGIEGFTGHSTRSAATSKAKAKGLSIDTILERGNWKRKNTWEKHYHKAIKSSSHDFQKAVLQL